MIILQDENDIYFKKTKEYFREIMSDYSNGNYRSAIVMLYSVAICDLLMKLQELKEVYNDSTAIQILADVESNSSGSGSKSKWEKEFVDDVYKRTDLLDLKAYTELNHLYDHRNFSAHPAMNDNYDLVVPSRETTIGHITNMLRNIFVKPPVFAKSVVGMMTDDISNKKEIFAMDPIKFKAYIRNKYIEKMTSSMKINTFKTLWKFTFCKPDDVNCMSNIRETRFVLEELIEHEPSIVPLFDSEEVLKSVSKDETCGYHLCIFISKYPEIYAHLSDEIKLCISPLVNKRNDIKLFSWFLEGNKRDHLKKIMDEGIYNVNDGQTVEYVLYCYKQEGLIKEICDYCISCYACSPSFDDANFRYYYMIRPNLPLFNKEQLIELIEAINDNDQIYNRGAAFTTNGEIVLAAIKVLDSEFDFTKYSRFKFNNSLISDTQ